MIPTVWEFALLGLATYRVFRLLSQDSILDRPRDWFLGPHNPGSGILYGGDVFRNRRHHWLMCPYCSGAWIALAWWLAFIVWPHGTLVAAVPFALSGAVAVFAAHLDP